MAGDKRSESVEQLALPLRQDINRFVTNQRKGHASQLRSHFSITVPAGGTLYDSPGIAITIERGAFGIETARIRLYAGNGNRA